MFKKLKNKIIIITMAITTTVLILAGTAIMLSSSKMRPEPKYHPEFNNLSFGEQELQNYIKSDREEGDTRLLITLFCVGIIVEVAVFLISYYLSQKITQPVQDAYDKQKLFIANASHELKTPLAVIQANMEALEVDQENEKWKTNIDNEITHANKLVLDLLQLAKMDAGNIEKSPTEKFDLTVEIKKHIESFKPKFSGKIIYKTTSAAKTYSLPKQDFFQVFDILLDNATKYGKQKIVVKLNENSVSIENDGATISKDDQKKIFDRFYQTDKTKSGSGLGLAIAKALCDQNHWQLSVTSTKTTTFNIKW